MRCRRCRFAVSARLPHNDRVLRGSFGGHRVEDPRREATAGADADHSLMLRLVPIVTAQSDSVEMARGALEALCDEFGARSGNVTIACRDESDDLLLIPTAVIGPHASLLGDLPPISAASSTEAAGVFRSGVATFIDDQYADEGRAEVRSAELTGAARWRDQLAAQARAILPITAGGRRLGTLSLEWAAPRPFTDADRGVLSAAATLTGLGLAHLESSAARDAAEDPAESMRFALTPEGDVRSGPADEPNPDETVRITAQCGSRSWIDVHRASAGRVLLLIATVRESAALEPQGVEALRLSARAAASQSNPDETVAALHTRFREMAPAGAVLEAWVGIWSASGALEHASLGASHARLLLADGRQMSLDGAADRAVPAVTWLPIAGDVLHAWLPGAADVRVEWASATV